MNYDFSAERIKAIRIGLGETQQEFAKRLDVSPTSVENWESSSPKATRPRSGKVLRALLDAEALAELRERRRQVDLAAQASGHADDSA